jgi:hypothetical protein
MSEDDYSSVSELPRWQERYRQLREKLTDVPWILQGTVIEMPPSSAAAHAKPTYIWTRKVRAKTVTVALSRQQFLAFRRAIDANRRLERVLTAMRQLSQRALLNSLPGVNKRSSKRRKTKGSPSSQHVLK